MVNPCRGTETINRSLYCEQLLLLFIMVNPCRGTETSNVVYIVISSSKLFIMVNPCRGTETCTTASPNAEALIIHNG